MDYILHGSKGVMEFTEMYKVKGVEDVFYNISSQVYDALKQSHVEVSPEKFAHIVKFLHKETIDTGAPPSEDKVRRIVKLAL